MCRLAALILAAGSAALSLAAGSAALAVQLSRPNFGWWTTDMETVAAVAAAQTHRERRLAHAPAHRMLNQHHRRYKNEPRLCFFNQLNVSSCT